MMMLLVTKVELYKVDLLVTAMGDPRYDTDEAYRDDVLRKLDASDLQF